MALLLCEQRKTTKPIEIWGWSPWSSGL